MKHKLLHAFGILVSWRERTQLIALSGSAETNRKGMLQSLANPAQARPLFFSQNGFIGLLAALMMLTATSATAQTWHWAKQPAKAGSSNPNSTTGQSVRTDAAGNVYVLGSLAGSSVYGSTTLNNNAGSTDVTLSKLTAAGAWLWTTTIASSTSDSPRSLAVAPNGDVYVSGTYDSAPITIGSTPHANAGSVDIFIAKYNTSGTLQWSAHAGGAGTDIAAGMAVDPNNNLIVAGYFQQTTSFGSFALTRAGTTSSDVFVAKLSSSGAWLWAKRGGGTTSDFCRGMDVDASGNIFIVGSFRGTGADFGTTLMTSAGGGTNNDVLLAKLDNDGNWLWARQAGSAQTDGAQGAAVDAAGNVYVTGSAMGTAVFGTASITTTSTTVADIFVAKADAAGTWQWAVKAGSSGSNDDTGYDIDADTGGNLYVTGALSGAATFGSITTSYNASNDIFVAKINSSGTWQWATQAGGSNFEEGLSIAADDAGSAYIAGTYSSGSIAFGGTTLSSNPVAALYVSKVGIINTAPSISAQSFSLSENAANATTVGAVAATDADAGTTLSYSITAGNTGGAFTFVGSSLRVANVAALDFETNPSFALTVQVSDGSLNSSATVTVNLSNVNESPSVAAQLFNILENSPNGSTVGTVVASDPDAGTTLTYSITAGNTGGAFTFVGSSLRVANSAALNYETTPTFTLTVQVSDGTNTSTAAMAINLSNVNEAPVFTNQGFSGLAENSANGTVVGSVAGTDPEGVTLSYSITAGNTGGAFTFVGNSLRVASSAALNFETTPSFALTVQASDGSNTTTATVSVNLANVNESPSIAAQTFSLNENAANATTVGTVVASDVDAGSTLTYSITAGNAGGAFTFVGSSLRVASSAALNYETTPSFALTVQVSDGSLSSSATVTVNLNDLDEIAPTVAISSPASPATTTSPISMTVTFSESVTGFTTTDVAVGNGTLNSVTGSGSTYTLSVTPAGAGAVTVNIAANGAQDGAGNGNIAAPQFSISYSLPSVAVTAVTPITPSPAGTAAVSYAVTFSGAVTGLSTSNFSLTTTGLSGASVASVTGSGSAYTVLVNTGSGDGTLRLNVANNSGISPVASNLPYPSAVAYTITKTFTNPVITIVGTGSSNAGDVTAFVDQVQLLQASNSAVVSGAVANGSFETHNALGNGAHGYDPTGASWAFNPRSGIAENGSAFSPPTTPNGVAVAFVQSSGSNGQLQQTLTSPAGSFQIRFQAAQRNCCNTVQDQALNTFINGVFVGSIQPANNGAYSTFTSDAFTVGALAPTDLALSNSSVVENATSGTAVGTLSSTSLTPGEAYTYTLVSGSGSANNASFSIVGGQLNTAASFNFEAQSSYAIRVRSTNSSNAALNYEKALVISVTNVNEAPSIGVQAFTLAENSALNTVVGAVAASDVDAGTTLSYSITAGNTGGAFTFVGSSLQVANAAALDFETTPSFVLTVQVSDGSLSSSATITVNLSDVAEAPTNLSLGNTSVNENQAGGMLVGLLSTTGPGSSYTYTLVAGFGSTGNSSFQIVGNQLQTAASFNFEAQSSYTIRVRTTDANAPTQFIEGSFAITVSNLNEAPSISAQSFSLNENAANGTTVGAVAASDVDAGTTLSYSITAGNTGGAFTFVGSSLRVANVAALDFETNPSFALTVQVSDGSLSSSATVTVNLNNVNEAPSIVAQTFSLSENTANSSTVGTVAAADPDAGATLTYSITAGNTGGAFTFVGNSLRVANSAALNYETTPSFALTVQVSDGTNTSAATVTVNLSNVNEAPAFASQSFLGLPENSANGTIVGNVVASDVDAGTTLTYSITAGNTGGAFALVGNSLRVASSAALDFETTASFALTVQVSDGSLSSPATVTVTLSDVDDTAPAAPVVLAPANGSLSNDNTPTYSGTAEASSTVTVLVNGSTVGTTTTDAGGNWTFTQPTALADASHPVRATATDAANNTSGSSSTNTFTVDTAAPSVNISSLASNPTSASLISMTATFSESVSGFTAADLTITNGTLSNFSGSGATYTFDVTPTAGGTVAASIAANAALDAAGNGNLATAFALSYVVPVVQWNGSVSTDWFTAANWTGGQPSVIQDATINAGVPRYPLIAAGAATAKNLSLSAGASLTMSGGTLDLKGNISNAGTFAASGGTVTLSSATAQNIAGSSTTRFWDLSVGSAGVGLSGPAAVQRLATLTGNVTTNGQTFTLESTPMLSAMLVNSGGVVVGNATVQRAITPTLNAGAGYRHYSSPVLSTTVADLTTPGFTPVVNSAYNSSATPTTVTPFPTVLGYDQARLGTTTNNLDAFSKGWVSPAALSDVLVPGRGYSANLGASQKVDFVGILRNTDLPLTLARNSGATAADAGWHHLGNPYPAPIDWSLVLPADRPNVDASLYVYESTSQYGGVYRTYVNGVGNPLIPVAQGFWVRVSTGQTAASLTLRNSQRLTTYQATTFRRGGADSRPLVQLQLQGASGPADAAYVYFESGATAGVDQEFDAVKLANSTGLNLSAQAGSQELAINGLPMLGTASVTVPLQVRVPATGSYTLRAAELLNLAGTHAYLRDRQTGALVDLSQQPSYHFTMNAAYSGGRFELLFSPQAVLATASASLSAQVAVYPNPASKSVFVELPATLGRKAVTVALVDALGRQVLAQTLPAAGAQAHQLPLLNVAAGVYSLRISTEQGTVTKKLVVE
jgi:hypothetical protein